METLKTSVGIRKFRERARYNTQTDLADTLGINSQNVSFWEAGKGFPSFQVAKKLLELGAMVEEVFGVEYEKMHGYAKVEATNNDLLLHIIKDLASVKSDISDLKGAKKPQMARTA